MVKVSVKMIIALCLCVGLGFAKDYTLDSRSHIGFKVKKFGVMSVEGVFKQSSGNLTLEGDVIKRLKGEIIIKSVFTDSQKRDKHLLESDFLDEARFAKGEFIMTDYQEQSRTQESIKGQVIGNLTLHGISQPVVFESIIENIQANPTINLTSEINIKDFDIQGSMMNSDKVSITLKTIWNP